MRKSIATVCLSGTLDAKMAACAEAGFSGIELFEPDLVVSPASPAQIRARAADLGLSLDLYQPFRDFDGVTPDLLKANLRRAEAKFRLMNQLGTDTMLLCTNVATATIDDDALMAEQLYQLGELAAAHGVRVAYEALAWGRYVNEYEHAWRIVEMADHPAIGTCLDSFHILSRNSDPAGIEKIPAEKIFFCQLADAPKLSLDVLSWSRHYRVFPGQGNFDLPTFMAHLVRTGYTGPVSLEVFNDVFRQTDARRTAVDAMRSLIWLEERTAQVLDSPEGNSTGNRMQLATLPRVPEPTGFNFAEVKAGHTSAIESLLGQLGFAFDGRHRTKPVQLWTQGQVRIILNEQAAATPEPAVAALGFNVQNPPVAAARATQLRAHMVPRQSQADEEVLQAVYAPDTTEIFLCQATPDGTAAWAGEFAAREFAAGEVAGAAAGTAGDNAGAGHLLTHIDHVNLAQPWQHYDEAVLFYESALSLTASPSQDVPGPTGLVRSQVMRSADGSVRLALNVAPLGPEGAGALGSGYPQHIAFACTDIPAVARRARDRGLRFLPIPANYYDDLHARFDLDAGFLTVLKELNLLYDRDGEGEFLHFYTATVGNVFFEVVERRGGYDGYGAPNAPVRLAAQFVHSTDEHSTRAQNTDKNHTREEPPYGE